MIALLCWAMGDSISRLYQAAHASRHDDPSTSRTARLLRSGRSKMAKKLAEEAVEVVIDAMNGDREAVVKESADLIYNLVVLWVATGIRPEDVLERNGPARAAPRHSGEGAEKAARRSGAPESRRSRGPPRAQAALISAAETPRSCQAPHPPHRRRMDIHRPCR